MGEVTIKAVDGVDFTVDKGEFTIIVGPSGAGKTTVLNMLGGMDACSGGTITVDGARVSDYNPKQLTAYRRHDIGFVFQFYNLVQNLTALENVELAAQICTRMDKKRFMVPRISRMASVLRWFLWVTIRSPPRGWDGRCAPPPQPGRF